MNLQIHCDQCGTSLAQVDQNKITKPTHVQLYDADPMEAFNRTMLFNSNAHNFCDWKCAAAWCLAHEVKS